MSRTANAEYQRRWRQRQKLGLAVVPAEVELLGFAGALVRDGYLRERDANNFDAICAAHSRLLDDYIEGRKPLLGGCRDRR